MVVGESESSSSSSNSWREYSSGVVASSVPPPMVAEPKVVAKEVRTPLEEMDEVELTELVLVLLPKSRRELTDGGRLLEWVALMGPYRELALLLLPAAEDREGIEEVTRL